MKVIENENCLFFDVDDTLVMWGSQYVKEDDNGNLNTVSIASPFYTPSMYATTSPIYQLVPHTKHIQYLKDSKQKNKNTIVVWSAGGWQWAEAVVKALGIEEYVDCVMSKPHAYVDDLNCKEFMGTRIYKEFKPGE